MSTSTSPVCRLARYPIRLSSPKPARSTLTATPSWIEGSAEVTIRSRSWSAWSSASLRRTDALAQAQLRQARARAHQNREGPWGDFGEQLPVIAGADGVEFLRPIGDDAGEHVDPAGRTLGVCRRREIGRKREALLQLGDIDAARLQDGAGRQVDLVITELDEPVPDRVVATGQEACPHAIGALPNRRSRLAGWI